MNSLELINNRLDFLTGGWLPYTHVIGENKDILRFKKENSEACYHFSILTHSNKIYIDCSLELKKVENILLNLLEIYEIEKQNIYVIGTSNFTISSKLISLSKGDLELKTRLSTLEINAKNIDEISNIINLLANKYYIPFWKKYSDLQNLNAKIEECALENMHKYSVFPYGIFRTMIVLKLAGSSRYPDFVRLRDGIYLEALKKAKRSNNKLERIKIMYFVFQALDSILQNNVKKQDELAQQFRAFKKHNKVKQVKPNVLEKSIVKVSSQLLIKYQNAIKCLDQIGIKILEEWSVSDLVNSRIWKHYEMDTKSNHEFLYYMLLISGSKAKKNESSNYNKISNNAFYLNLEFDGYIDYAEVFQELTFLSNDEINVTKLNSLSTNSLAFNFRDNEYLWKFKDDRDWIDVSFFKKFVNLVKNDLSNNYYFVREGQSVVFLYLSDKQKENFKFIYSRSVLMLLERAFD